MRTLLCLAVCLLCGIGDAKAQEPISFAGDVIACELPDCISFDGDVKPLPDRYIEWPMQNPNAGSPVEW